MELETKLVEHMEQKVEEIPADDILRVEVLEYPENLWDWHVGHYGRDVGHGWEVSHGL